MPSETTGISGSLQSTVGEASQINQQNMQAQVAFSQMQAQSKLNESLCNFLEAGPKTLAQSSKEYKQ